MSGNHQRNTREMVKGSYIWKMSFQVTHIMKRKKMFPSMVVDRLWLP